VDFAWLHPESMREPASWHPTPEQHAQPGADTGKVTHLPRDRVCSVHLLKPPANMGEGKPGLAADRRLLVAAPRIERVSLVNEELVSRGYEVAHAAPSSREQLASALQQFEGRVFVMHVGLLDVIELHDLLHLRRQFPAIDFVLAWQQPWPMLADLVVRFEARGCIDFDDDRTIARAIDTVVAGELWFPRWVMDALYPALLSAQRLLRIDAVAPLSVEGPALTQRETEAFELMRQGLTNKQIARRLEISSNTIKKHLKNAFEKRGLHSRRQAVG